MHDKTLDNEKTLLKQVDQTLYKAKHEGGTGSYSTRPESSL
ncbi:MAG: hypothetical protein ACE5DY_08250 [Mariprofundaceae bacterium]